MKALELKVPPVAVLLIVGALMWVLAKKWPVLPLAFPGRTAVAVLIGLAGLSLGGAGVMIFRRLQTTVHPSHPEKASTVVADGIYRFSRNPMYLGLALVLSGWAVFLGDVANVVLLAAFVAYMNQFQIKPEERALESKFGESYADYKSKVRRWL